MWCNLKELTSDEQKSFSRMYTKQLLKARFYWELNEYCRDCDSYKECLKIAKQNKQYILDLLKTREHVLNKQESKQLRKDKIKRGV